MSPKTSINILQAPPSRLRHTQRTNANREQRRAPKKEVNPIRTPSQKNRRRERYNPIHDPVRRQRETRRASSRLRTLDFRDVDPEADGPGAGE